MIFSANILTIKVMSLKFSKLVLFSSKINFFSVFNFEHKVRISNSVKKVSLLLAYFLTSPVVPV